MNQGALHTCAHCWLHSQMEAKAKQDKVLEIKRLTTAIAALRSEMNKYEEQLEDCRWVQPLAGKTLGMCP